MPLPSEPIQQQQVQQDVMPQSSVQAPAQYQGTTATAQPHHHSTHTQHAKQSNQDLSSRASLVKWIEHLPRESLVIVTGKLQKPANAQGKILEASEGLQGVELAIDKMFVVGRVTETAPFKFTDIQARDEAAEQDKEQGPKITVRNELNNRVFDLRVSLDVAAWEKTKLNNVIRPSHLSIKQSSVFEHPCVTCSAITSTSSISPRSRRQSCRVQQRKVARVCLKSITLDVRRFWRRVRSWRNRWL